MSKSGREIIPEVRVRSGGRPGCPSVVVRPSRMSGSGWEALPDVRERLRGPWGFAGVVGRP